MYLILPGTHSIAHFRVTFVQMQKDCFGDIYSFEHIFKDVLFYSERGSRCHENELCRRMTENKSVKCMIYIYINVKLLLQGLTTNCNQDDPLIRHDLNSFPPGIYYLHQNDIFATVCFPDTMLHNIERST